MAQDYRNIQKSVFSAEFKNFCRKELCSKLNKLENVRILHIIGMILCCIIGSALIIGVIYVDFSGIYKVSEGLFKITVLIGIGSIVSAEIIRKDYKTRAKDIILEKLLSFIGDFKINDDKNIENHIAELKLFDKFNRFYCDDRLSGNYKLLNLDIAQLDLRYVTGSGKNRHEKIVFQGILIKLPNMKKYKSNCYTIIRQHSLFNFENRNRVHLEDIEFEKYYDVYSDDQIEARYMLTTSFMERMTQLAKKGIGQNIKMSFENGNIYIAVSSAKDWFEIPIFSPASKIENFRAIVLEIITLLKIIDALNLDRKIGL